MKLNTIRPAVGAKKSARRVGRGIGCGRGKTCGRGHKGQRARSGGYHKVGFEGGQMPIQRRMPKSGFCSRKSLLRQEVRLSQLNKILADVVNIQSLKKFGVVRKNTKYVKIIASGKLDKTVNIVGIPVSKGARALIESLGGSVEV